MSELSANDIRVLDCDVGMWAESVSYPQTHPGRCVYALLIVRNDDVLKLVSYPPTISECALDRHRLVAERKAPVWLTRRLCRRAKHERTAS